MRLLTTCLTFALATALLTSTGCSPDARLRAYQQQSQERIEGLESQLQAERDKSESITGELQIEQSRLAKIQTESEIQKEKFAELAAQFDALAEKAGRGGLLSQQISDSLSQLASQNSELLSYDPARGLVQLKSDFTFALASDRVKSEAGPVLAALGEICSPDQAGDLQVLIVGHTDDVPIVHPETRAKHPTNWHLSVHRAIAVMDILKKSMPEQRLSVMGFGQWRPVEPNQPGQRGNPANRRVEIYIVPRDSAVPSGGLK